MATRQEIDKLKKEWLEDPIFDLAETEGFEEHREELLAFQKEWETIWTEEQESYEKELDRQAEKIGVHGLYRMLLKQEEIIKRQEKAIYQLCDNNSYQAYRTMMGYEE